MSSTRFDVIVIGVGGMGSAAACHLARRGRRVLGLDRFGIPNSMGASHGLSRIIRLAYFEDPAYVPLLRRAYELWRELEAEAGETLLTITGGIDAGQPGSRVFEGSLRSCQEHRLAHEVLTSAELSRRYSAYRLPAQTMAVLQPDAGFLVPERCVAAHAAQAAGQGAVLHPQEQVLDWEAGDSGVKVRTDRATYLADRLVVTAGPWAGKLVPELAQLVTPERQVVAWFATSRPELFEPARFPVFVAEVEEGLYYGFPEVGVPGFKVGRFHHRGEQTDPDGLQRRVHRADEELLQEFVARYFPEGAGEVVRTSVCMFSNSPDEHFIIDHHPAFTNVVLAAGFSGHGFKFCSVVGEILADLALEGGTDLNVDLFKLDRFR